MRRRIMGLLAALTLASAFGVTSASAQSEPTTTTAPQSPPKVVLVDPGSGPRHVLRYSVKAGSEQKLLMSINTKIEQRIGKKSSSGTVPQMNLHVAVVVNAVDANGNIEAALQFRAVDVRGDKGSDVTRRLDQALKKLVGFSQTTVIAPDGSVVSADLSLPDDLDPTVTGLLQQFSDQLKSLAVPFPSEPIGAGATWTATTTATIVGAKVTQTYKYHLTSNDHGRLKVTATASQRIKNQRITIPDSGETATIVSSRSTTRSTATITLDELVARTSTHTTAQQRLRSGGTDLSQNIVATISIKPD